MGEKIRNYLVTAEREARGHAVFTERQGPVQSADRSARPIRSRAVIQADAVHAKRGERQHDHRRRHPRAAAGDDRPFKIDTLT